MTREMIDTNSRFTNKDIPDGTYEFTVQQVSKKYGGSNKDKPFYVWTLTYNGDSQGEQVMMPNRMGDLLRALGCKEAKPGVFDWDTDDVVYSKFTATIFHEPDKKDPSKIRQGMKDFKGTAQQEQIPF